MNNIDKQTDKDVLGWIYCRLRNTHNNHPNNSFMVRLRKIIDRQLLNDVDIEKLIKLSVIDTKLCNKLKSIRFNR